jgi:tRNA(Ile)-lysidine synthase
LRAVGVGEPPDRAAVEAVCAAIVAGRDWRTSLRPGRFLALRDGRLWLEAANSGATAEPWPGSRLEPGGELVGPRGDRIRARVVRATSRLLARVRAGDFPQGEVAHVAPPADWPGWFEVRGWRPGDRYRPIGAPGRRKLQDLFVDQGVPRELRRLLPVVVISPASIVWVPGLRVADAVGIQPTAKLVVQLTYVAVPPMVNRSTEPTSQDV